MTCLRTTGSPLPGAPARRPGRGPAELLLVLQQGIEALQQVHLHGARAGLGQCRIAHRSRERYRQQLKDALPLTGPWARIELGLGQPKLAGDRGGRMADDLCIGCVAPHRRRQGQAVAHRPVDKVERGRRGTAQSAPPLPGRSGNHQDAQASTAGSSQRANQRHQPVTGFRIVDDYQRLVDRRETQGWYRGLPRGRAGPIPVSSRVFARVRRARWPAGSCRTLPGPLSAAGAPRHAGRPRPLDPPVLASGRERPQAPAPDRASRTSWRAARPRRLPSVPGTGLHRFGRDRLGRPRVACGRAGPPTPLPRWRGKCASVTVDRASL